MRTLVAMVSNSFNRLIMGKVEIGNFYCLIGDNRILFLQYTTISYLSVQLRPRATVHRVIHSTDGVIVLTVAQKGMK